MTTIQNRYEIVLLADIVDGNPNGDPDGANAPRTDPETNHGLITDVCTKRKIRNYIAAARQAEDGYGIYVSEGAVLDRFHAAAIERAKASAGEKQEDLARKLMCEQFYDLRTFGAVMAGDHNLGRLTGPVQVQFGRTIDPIYVQEHAITRMAASKEKDAAKGQTIGRKSTIPYGLYRINMFVSPLKAMGEKGTGFSTADLETLFEALQGMYDVDRSSGRTSMSVRKLVAFRHDNILGRAPANLLLDRVAARKVTETPRAFSDYEVTLDEADLPTGVTVQKIVW